MLRHIVTKLVVQSIIMLCTTFLCLGQIKILNPSFEDTITINYSGNPNYFWVHNWNICSYTPDILTFNPTPIVHPKATNGNFYLHVAGEYNYPIRESVSATPTCILKKHINYSFSLDLRLFFVDSLQLFSGVMELYGDALECNHSQILWTSPILDTINWKRCTIHFTSNSDIKYLYFTSRSTINHGVMTGAGVLVDNLSSISIDSGYTNVKATATINSNCTSLNCTFNQGTANDYKVRWYTKNGITISNNFNPIVCPIQTTTYFVWAKDSCGYYSTDSVIVEPTPNNTAFYNSSKRELQLTYTTNQTATFQLYNAIGQIEQTTILNSSLHQANIILPSMSTGIYIAVIKNESNKITWRQKIFIHNQ